MSGSRDLTIRMNAPIVSCLAALLLIQTASAYWTGWSNRDTYTGNGDYETIADGGDGFPPLFYLVLLHWDDLPKNPCGSSTPKKIQARVAGTTNVILSTDEQLDIGPDYGLACRNNQQADGWCRDYSIRFEDPQISVWFDRDNAGGVGDFEIKDLITGTAWRDGKFVAWSINSELFGRVDRKLKVGPGYGLACTNSQQNGVMCKNYEVRYFC